MEWNGKSIKCSFQMVISFLTGNYYPKKIVKCETVIPPFAESLMNCD